MSNTFDAPDDQYRIPGSQPARRSPHMVYLLIDCSTSMEGDAIEQARVGAHRFAAEARRKGYRVGLIRFADHASALLNPDTGFEQALDDLVAFGNTNLTEAIELATAHLLNEATGQRVMCIVTDGMPNRARAALKAAKRAADVGIHIMAIGTAGADRKYLDKLVTTKNLASYVAADSLQAGVTDMALLLPPPKDYD